MWMSWVAGRRKVRRRQRLTPRVATYDKVQRRRKVIKRKKAIGGEETGASLSAAEAKVVVNYSKEELERVLEEGRVLGEGGRLGEGLVLLNYRPVQVKRRRVGGGRSGEVRVKRLKKRVTGRRRLQA